MSDRFVAAHPLGRTDEDRQKHLQGQTRTVIERFSTVPDDARLAQQMALLADGLSQGRPQVTGVDDGRVRAVQDVAALAAFDVQLARPVAPLAADGVAAEDRLLVVAQRVGDRLDAVAVAEQTIGVDRPLEAAEERLIGRRKIPDALVAGVPADRRFKQVAAAVD